MINYDGLYDKNYYGESLVTNNFVEKELTFRVIENATILPFKKVQHGTGLGGGVVDEDGSYLTDSSLHSGFGVPYEYDESLVEYRHKTALYIGLLHHIYGHWLTDNIKRMWFFKTEEYRSLCLDDNIDLIYIPLGVITFDGTPKEMLEILKLPWQNFVPITSIVRYDKVIYPDECFFTPDGSERFFTKEYRGLIDEIRSWAMEHRTACETKKIYFSYANYKQFKGIGEKRIESYLRKQEYHILYPEKLTFKDQLNFLINCDRFASTIGSCSHNVLFLKDGTEVMLIPRANYLTGYQLAIDMVHDLEIYYIDSTLSVFAAKAPFNGVWYFFISKNLMDYFADKSERNDRYWIENFKDYKTYMRFGLLYGQKANSDAYRYYSEVAAECLDSYTEASKKVRLKRVFQRYIILLRKRLGMLS